MPRGKHKSRTLRKVFRKTPGGRVVKHYRKRKVKAAKCSLCSVVLKGVTRKIPSKMAKLSKTKKKVSRPFGGNLCSRCARAKIKSLARF